MTSAIGSAVDLNARSRAHDAISLRAQKFPKEDLQLLAEEVLNRLASRFCRATDTPSEHEIDALADALISKNADEALAYVVSLQKKGISRETIYLGYLGGSARRLGERWEADTLSFAEVTLGSGRLYVILRALRPVFLSDNMCPDQAKVALFCSTPGEDHVLGVTIAADMFREQGWLIDLQTGNSHDDIVLAATARTYAIIGVSAGSRRMVVPMTRLIASLRVVSPSSYILVSGELTSMEDDLATIVDADFVAHNATEAMEELNRFAGLVQNT